MPHHGPVHTFSTLKIHSFIRYALATLALAGSLASTGAVPVLRSDYEAFIDEVSTKYGHDVGWLRQLFSQVQLRPSILRAMSAPATARPWYEFQKRIVEPGRIEAGLRFWAANSMSLARASRQFGVPEEFIVATIGIETLYGRNTGNFKVMDALATLAFDYPPRADFFRSELEEYLLLAKETGIDAAAMRGSYAGAIGLPQFIPSSYRKYAIDFDGDGRRDLINSASDAIGSVANYYRSFGWTTGGEVVVAVQAGTADVTQLIAAGLRPHTKISDLKALGFAVDSAVDEATEASVFSIETESGPQVMLGLNNFYVITRYNRSVNYAMAVYELARSMRAQMNTAAAAEPASPAAR
jgi:membrane-bound lytic murein transglycosylase B